MSQGMRDWDRSIDGGQGRARHYNDANLPGALAESKADVIERNAGHSCSPAFTCLDRHGERQRSGRNDFTRAELRIVLVVREQFHQMAQSDKRTAEHESAAAALAQVSVTIKLGLKRCQFMLPCRLTWRDRVAMSDQQRSMQAICGDRIGSCECPFGEYRLHDLVTERHPLDAIEQCGLIHCR